MGGSVPGSPNPSLVWLKVSSWAQVGTGLFGGAKGTRQRCFLEECLCWLGDSAGQSTSPGCFWLPCHALQAAGTNGEVWACTPWLLSLLAPGSATALLTSAPRNHCLEECVGKSRGTEGGLLMRGLKKMYNYQKSNHCHHPAAAAWPQDICPWPEPPSRSFMLGREWPDRFNLSHPVQPTGVCACPWLEGWLRVRPSVSLCRSSLCWESLLFLSDQLPFTPLEDPELLSNTLFKPKVLVFLCDSYSGLEIWCTANRLKTHVRVLAQMQARKKPLENK